MNLFVEIAGWTLIHFAWEGALIALATGMALHVARFASANTRYLLACAGLAAMMVAPALTAPLITTSPRHAVMAAPATDAPEAGPDAVSAALPSEFADQARRTGSLVEGSAPIARALARAVDIVTVGPSDRAIRLIVL